MYSIAGPFNLTPRKRCRNHRLRSALQRYVRDDFYTIRRLHVRSCGDVFSYTRDSKSDVYEEDSDVDIDDDAGVGSPAIAPPETAEEVVGEMVDTGWMDGEINILFAVV